jgi:hypothetical protein
MFSKLLIAAALVASASAACPNACSGHGMCTNYEPQHKSSPNSEIELATGAYVTAYGYDTSIAKKDTCTCFTHLGHNGATAYQWTGADCSLQTCPHAASFAGSALNSNLHTQEVECSGKGSCDRKTGKCQCFDGYEGDACNRQACPNQCSNSGKCLTLTQIAEDVQDAVASYYGTYMGSAAYSAFDGAQMMGCVCDQGRSGPDCSLIDCPSSADPMGGAGSDGGRTCSGRGLCDGTTGTCQCFDGFFGTSCASQRNRMV